MASSHLLLGPPEPELEVTPGPAVLQGGLERRALVLDHLLKPSVLPCQAKYHTIGLGRPHVQNLPPATPSTTGSGRGP